MPYKDPIKKKEYHKQYYKYWALKNPDKILKYKEKFLNSNKDHILKYRKIYKILNKDKIKKQNREYQNLKCQVDINFKLKKNLRTRLYSSIKSNQKAGSAIQDLGCTISELKIYLESKFQKGMTWNNWGKGNDKWNIDHIIPLSKFNLSNRIEFLKACHYTNLQPLWEVDNREKSNKIEGII